MFIFSPRPDHVSVTPLSPLRAFYDVTTEYGFPSGPRRSIGTKLARLRHEFEERDVLSYDWDVLILLDTCRLDRFEGIAADRLPLVGGTGSIRSVESCTWRWIPETFDDKPDADLRTMGYVSANPFSELLPESVGEVVDVWEYAWDRDLGTVHPRAVTDAAIEFGRERDVERLVVHYLAPHAPFVSDPSLSRGASHFDVDSREGTGTWHHVQAGDVPAEAAIDAYEADLALVADEVSLLCENLSAERAVVSADHGESFGEYGIYGHPPSVPTPQLVEVPWAEVAAADERTRTTESHSTGRTTEREDKLEALGYR